MSQTCYLIFCYRVYCKYHYLEGHESANAEIEIFKFLVNISRNEIDITKKQYGEESLQSAEFNVSGESVHPFPDLSSDMTDII